MDELSVSVPELRSSATRVQSHGDELTVSHGRADSRMVAAHSGWVGSSGDALMAWTAAAKADSSDLMKSIAEHAQHMHSAAQRYEENEEQRAAEMDRLDPRG